MMAKIYAGSGAEDTSSNAETFLLDQFAALPDSFTVIHSAKWITHNSRQHGTVGEADFIIAHQKHGVLVLEVKGGQIVAERDHWFSMDRGGRRHEIKDPFAQSDRNRFALLDWLKHDKRTRTYDYPVYSAVAFPDADAPAAIRPDAPQEIIIDAQRVNHLEASLINIFDYWNAKYPHLKMRGPSAVEALVDLLLPKMTLSEDVSAIFERERRAIESLTERQYSVLRLLRHHRRAAIIGGAGTGKTMLAMEKSKQLATAGFRVLLLCFNRNLANWLAGNLKDDNIEVHTFHGLVAAARHWADQGRTNMRNKKFLEEAPDLLMAAIDILRAPDADESLLFDAIIVDEAQDFEETWWIPVRDLLKDPDEGIFYVFYDDNQRIYQQIGDIPMDREPLVLDENCRNTQAIHAILEPYSSSETISLGPAGRDVEVISVAGDKAARKALQQAVQRLIEEQNVPAEDIIVLTPAAEKRSQWKSDEMLGTYILTWDLHTEMQKAIRVCTIYSFKGMESPVVILTELDKIRADISNQLVYVGLSRARNHVVVIGDLPSVTE